MKKEQKEEEGKRRGKKEKEGERSTSGQAGHD